MLSASPVLLLLFSRINIPDRLSDYRVCRRPHTTTLLLLFVVVLVVVVVCRVFTDKCVLTVGRCNLWAATLSLSNVYLYFYIVPHRGPRLFGKPVEIKSEWWLVPNRTQMPQRNRSFGLSPRCVSYQSLQKKKSDLAKRTARTRGTK